MADQNITALPVATTPESSDQILLVGATEEKLIDYDKLADAILNKLTSKNFSLDQGAKTLLQALNELNSKLFEGYVFEDVGSITNMIKENNFLNGRVYFFHLSGVGYSGNDLPSENYMYGSGIIFYRNPSSCKIILFSEVENPVWKMSGWTNWKDFAGNTVN